MDDVKTSRQKILDYFRLHHTASASELSRVMQMTSANARHHLKILVDEGAVIQIGERMPVNLRGRPEKVYGFAEAMQKNNLAILAGLLLKINMPTDGSQESLPHLQALSSGLIEMVGGMVPQRSLGPRLVQTVQILNRLNYQARWEARPGPPEINLGYCPYQEIIHDHPELCHMDANLLRSLSGLQAEQIGKLVPDRSGRRFCRFLMHSTL